MIYLNLFGYWWYQKDLSWSDLMFFIFVSCITMSVLLFYYRKIANKGEKSQVESRSIYNSKDIFSQEIVGETNFALIEKTTSIFTKIAVYALVFVLLTSSSSMLLKNLYLY